ncbi:MAG: RNA polymerase sigma factor [Spirochaetes bacterium]|nr:RNA polymerase sigma factor [Spirochaetota bacterium]
MKGSSKVKNEELVRCFQKGDHNVFGEIVKLNHRYVFKIALKFLRSIEDAEDLTQEIFLKLYHYLPKFKFKSDLKTYLYKMVQNAASDYYKKEEKIKEKYVDLELQISPERIDEKILEEETLGEMEQAIIGLSDKYKEVILLKDFQGLSYKEIGKRLKISENAAKMRHFHALKILKSRFQDLE